MVATKKWHTLQFTKVRIISDNAKNVQENGVLLSKRSLYGQIQRPKQRQRQQPKQQRDTRPRNGPNGLNGPNGPKKIKEN